MSAVLTRTSAVLAPSFPATASLLTTGFTSTMSSSLLSTTDALDVEGPSGSVLTFSVVSFLSDCFPDFRLFLVFVISGSLLPSSLSSEELFERFFPRLPIDVKG